MRTPGPDGLAVLIAGGGTAGHVEPALAVADAIVAADAAVVVTCLGTAGGLENILVPERGYRLELIPQVKFRRKLDAGLFAIPVKLLRTVAATGRVIEQNGIDVVVGFGGYVALPAYLAARRRRVPIIVHEANARAGIANKIGARFADVVVAAVPGSGLAGARVVGNPVRRSLSGLDLEKLRPQAREFFGLDPTAPTVVVVGGSSGAAKFNDTFSGVAADLAAAGVGVLHMHGRAKSVNVPPPPPGAPPYVPMPYVNRMDLLYAAADLLVTRAGAITVAEIGALGVPVVYVPLAFGNGEQRLNALPQVRSGAARMIDDADFTADAIREQVITLVKDSDALAAMRAAAGANPVSDADVVIARLALTAGRTHRRQAHQRQAHRRRAPGRRR